MPSQKDANAPEIFPPYVADALPSELLVVLGEIIFRWGRLQWQLANMLVVGFEVPKDTGLVLTSTMDIGFLCDTLRALTYNECWVSDEPLREEIRRLAGDVKNKASVRNNYAHGVFGYDLDEPDSFARYIFRAKEKGEVVPAYEPVTLEKLRLDASEAQVFVRRTIDLTIKLKKFRINNLVE